MLVNLFNLKLHYCKDDVKLVVPPILGVEFQPDFITAISDNHGQTFGVSHDFDSCKQSPLDSKSS